MQRPAIPIRSGPHISVLHTPRRRHSEDAFTKQHQQRRGSRRVAQRPQTANGKKLWIQSSVPLMLGGPTILPNTWLISNIQLPQTGDDTSNSSANFRQLLPASAHSPLPAAVQPCSCAQLFHRLPPTSASFRATSANLKLLPSSANFRQLPRCPMFLLDASANLPPTSAQPSFPSHIRKHRRLQAMRKGRGFLSVT